MPNTAETRPDDWPSFAVTGDKTRPAPDSAIASGFPQTTLPPTRQEFNWAFNQVFKGVRYLLQIGLADWSATEIYPSNAKVMRGGLTYISSSGNTNVDPATNPGTWERWGQTTTQINALIASALSTYSTTATIAANYVSNSSLTTTLAGYVTSAYAAANYVTNGALTTTLASYVTGSQLATAVQAALATSNPSNLPPASLGIFGTGRYRLIMQGQTWVVPAAVVSIRVRLCAGGGGSLTGGKGGSGGGYAHGVFAVTPGNSYTATVGAGGTSGGSPTAGSSSSFGALISATGGAANGGTPGAGTGGDFQASGGTANGLGGAAAGSQLGKGGDSISGASAKGGAAVGGISNSGEGGASAFGTNAISVDAGGPDCLGTSIPANSASPDGIVNAVLRPIRFPFDGFTGGGGAATTTTPGGKGGPGAGGGSGSGSNQNGGAGGAGGGGGAAGSTGSPAGGAGGYGAGAGQGGAGTGPGGQGFIVVEW